MIPDPPRAGDTLQLQTRTPFVVAVEVHLREGGRQVVWLDVDSLARYLVPESAVVLRIHAFPLNEKIPETFLTRVVQPSPEADLWKARFHWKDPELSSPGKADTAGFHRVLQRYADHPYARVWPRDEQALHPDQFALPDSLTVRFASRQEAYAWYVTLRARRKQIPGVYDTLRSLVRTFFVTPDWPDLPEMIRWGAYAFSRVADRTLWLEATRTFWEGRPGEGPLWAMLAEGRSERGDTAGAREAFARAWKVMPTPDVLQGWLDLVRDSTNLAVLLRRMDTLETLPPVWRDPRLAFRRAADHRRWWNESMAELELSLSERLESMGDLSRARTYARPAYARPGEYPPREDRARPLARPHRAAAAPARA
ncbi:MAG: hypothetical protein L3J76_03535, partial [Candidatus Hydrothermae bacterium]|nr:hypothetical protein [Candidatus Hydrothermae bacterium]